jgi:hypothetical protein
LGRFPEWGGKALRQRPERFAEQPFDDPVAALLQVVRLTFLFAVTAALKLSSAGRMVVPGRNSDWTTLAIRPWISGLAQLAVHE